MQRVLRLQSGSKVSSRLFIPFGMITKLLLLSTLLGCIMGDHMDEGTFTNSSISIIEVRDTRNGKPVYSVAPKGVCKFDYFGTNSSFWIGLQGANSNSFKEYTVQHMELIERDLNHKTSIDLKDFISH